LQRKILAVKKWRYAVQLFDEKGKRVFTEYFSQGDFDEMLEFAKQHATTEKRARKPYCGIVIKREVVASKEWEAE